MFDDKDGDGKRDTGEKGVAGVPIVLNDQVVGATDAEGYFSLPLSGSGKAFLAIIPPEGWQWEGEPLDIEEMDEVAIPLYRQKDPAPGPITTAATVTSGVAVAALLVGLGFNGFASLAQAAAARSLERTYRRHKSQELELAMAQSLTARQEQVHDCLASDPDAWRKVVRQLLADTRVDSDATSVDEIVFSIVPRPHFIVSGMDGQQHYLFTTDPGLLHGGRLKRLRDRVIPLDAASSPFARVEAQALWDCLAQNQLRVEQHTLPRDAAWWLVVQRSTEWIPRARKKRRWKWPWGNRSA